VPKVLHDHPAWMREFVRLLRERAPVTSGEAVAR
jgi:hypothetical protein